MIKEFLIKQAIKHGTKNLPKDQADLLAKAVEKDPKLFEKIAKEIEELKKAGKPEMYAALDVMKKYQKELQTLFAQP
jgi:glucosamine 6-phosphate synthetase-like amidotransferase/phosphosugar isomerase protein